MKNLLLLFILSLFLIPIASSQNLCPDNIFINGNLENGTPTASDQDIDNAIGFSRIWSSGSNADYYTATAGPFTPPTPPTGNYAGCWIANYAGGGTTYREGFKGELMVTLPPNTGSYTLTFDMACLYGWGRSEVAVYGLHNPSNGNATNPPTGAFTPTNMNLFPAGTTNLLGTFNLNANSCSNTKTNQAVIIDTNDPNYPVGGITHIFITHSDNTTKNGALYMGFDNFCLAVSSDCPGSYVSNGDLESGTPTGSDQDIDNATDFRRIWASGSNADYYTATAGPFTPPTPPTGNYAGCWIANYNGGGTTYREGFQSRLVASIFQNTGSYTLNFDMACLFGWGASEVAVYGVFNPTNGNAPNPPTGAFTPSNIALFGASNTVLLGTISINSGSCSNTKANQSITFNSNLAGFPAEMTHFFLTHSDNNTLNGALYMGFDNFCLQSAQDTVVTTPCPEITNTEATCKVDDDGNIFYDIQITVNNPGTLNLVTTCGTISPTSLSIPTAGVYNFSFVSNGTCSPFQFEYQSFDANQDPCLNEEIFLQLPECPKGECICDESFFDAVNLGYNAVLGCPNDVFTPIALLDCDRVEWTIDGTPVASTVGNNSFVNPHITGQYELCMTVTRTQPDGTTCQHRFCRIIESSLVCRVARIGVTPNPASHQLTLTWSTENVPDQISISVFNSSGIEVRRVDAVNGHEGQLKIDLDKLESGMYFIKVEGAQYAPMPIKFVKKG